MANKFTDEEYAKIIPKKFAGTAILFFNTKGELLIVKPNYRKNWLLPGGVTDEDESPLHGAIRETREEIGLDVAELKLVGVYYGHKKGVFVDSFKFIFSGGTLSDDQVAQIKLQTEELEEYKFMSPNEAIPLLSASLQKCIPKCLDAIKNNTVGYIE